MLPGATPPLAEVDTAPVTFEQPAAAKTLTSVAKVNMLDEAAPFLDELCMSSVIVVQFCEVKQLIDR